MIYLGLGYHEHNKRNALSQEELVKASVMVAGNGPHPCSKGERTPTDYSEEAIPERDPAYRMNAGTLHEELTVDEMPVDMRRALARCLEQLGMSASRAAMVASL
jgi:hypothetical protein